MSIRLRFTRSLFALMTVFMITQCRGATPTTQAAPERQVAIDNFTFLPEEITIRLGTKVTWTNHDDIPHTATSSDNPKVFNSGALDTDATFSFVFQKAGTYSYFCAVHPHMTGRIIVK